MRTTPGIFYLKGSQLRCEGVALRQVAEQAGTPCYVYSQAAMVRNCRQFKSAFQDLNPLVCYAVKANSNLSVLRLLQQQGCAFEVVSGGELYRLLQIGADPSQICFSGVGKTQAELEQALELKIRAIHIESLGELDLVARLARARGYRPQISLRLNPDVAAHTHPYISTGLEQHKFGLERSQTDEFLRRLKKAPELQLVALSSHIGSQILELEPYMNAFGKLKSLAEEFRSKGVPVQSLNLGGGFGIGYDGEEPFDLKSYADALQPQCQGYSLIFEPGRFLVGNAGALLTRVLYRKSAGRKSFVVVDAGMNDLLRPSLYQAHHRIVSLSPARRWIEGDVVGPVCESADFLGRKRRLPDVRPGQYLAILDVGAYGFALSSNYNARARAAEVMIDGDQFRVIRRREVYEDLVRCEREVDPLPTP